VKRTKQAGDPGGRGDGRRAELRGTARERLLDAAEAEVAEHGYAGSSLQAIATRTGLTRGAVYWNFKSKPELFLALLDDRIDKPVRELMRLTETAPANQPTAASISQGLAQLIAARAPLIMLLFEHWAAAVRDPALRDAFNERQQRLRAALAKALEARHATTGVPLTFPADQLATAVLALAHGIAMSKLIDPDGTRDELQGEILDLLYDGLVHRASK
jgi:AcrR family transcriptional regulator